MKAWTFEEDAELKRLYATDATAREIGLAIGRTRAAIKNRVNTLGLKKPEGHTNSGRFMPGQKSWNKGKKGLDMGGRSHATRFKPGHLGGRAVEVYKPIGTERIVDGYLQRKTNDAMPLHKRWEFVHVLLWVAANGPVPKSCMVVFRNGDRTDIRIENLECITRREHMLRHTVQNLPEDLRQVIRLKGVVTKKINNMTKGGQS